MSLHVSRKTVSKRFQSRGGQSEGGVFSASAATIAALIEKPKQAAVVFVATVFCLRELALRLIGSFNRLNYRQNRRSLTWNEVPRKAGECDCVRIAGVGLFAPRITRRWYEILPYCNRS